MVGVAQLAEHRSVAAVVGGSNPLAHPRLTKIMKILIFLHGTAIAHKTAEGKTREEILKQAINKDPSIYDYASHIPVGNVVTKLKNWQAQGAEILYLSALTEDEKARGDEIVGKDDTKADQEVLNRYGFPKGEIYHRKKGESYAQIAEKIVPDVLIEDDCESIGGEKEMTITFVRPQIKQKIKSIVVKEFSGIDHLPDNLKDLLSWRNN